MCLGPPLLNDQLNSKMMPLFISVRRREYNKWLQQTTFRNDAERCVQYLVLWEDKIIGHYFKKGQTRLLNFAHKVLKCKLQVVCMLNTIFITCRGYIWGCSVITLSCKTDENRFHFLKSHFFHSSKHFKTCQYFIFHVSVLTLTMMSL